MQKTDWQCIFDQPHTVKCLKGGRNSLKSSTVASRFVDLALTQNSKRFLLARTVEKKIKESSYQAIAEEAQRKGVAHEFKLMQDRIVCHATNSVFLITGLMTNIHEIKSLNNIDYTWVEEANNAREEALYTLLPTVLRNDNSEIWFTWNPRSPLDPIERYFESVKNTAIWCHVNYHNNPFMTETAHTERLRFKEAEPLLYDHVWLGEFVPDNLTLKVLPYSMLQRAVGAAKKVNYIPKEPAIIGLDVADGGIDMPAIAVRQGASILMAEEMRKLTDTAAITDYALKVASQYPRCFAIFYDATGVGAGIKGEIQRLYRAGRKLPFTNAYPFFAGGVPKSKDKIYSDNIKQSAMFARYNSQVWWCLRQRLLNTCKLLDGQAINPNLCLFLPEDVTNQTLSELSQIEYKRDNYDRIVIDKAPHGTRSPNIADAIMMAFANDVRYGLRPF